MQKYLFTTDDGTRDTGDDEPIDLPCDEDAAVEARKALADMAKDGLASGSTSEYSAEVRDEKGQRVYAASLRLRTTKRPGPQS